MQGVPIDGYFHWTLSDNWEWADGYGPKFGLVAVDRENDLKRTPRPSYHLYAKVGSSTHPPLEVLFNQRGLASACMLLSVESVSWWIIATGVGAGR